MAGNCSSLGVGTTPGCSSIADSPDDALGERPVCASADRAMRPKAAVHTASSHGAMQLYRTTHPIRGLSGVCFSSPVPIELKDCGSKVHICDYSRPPRSPLSRIAYAFLQTRAFAIGAQASDKRASCFNCLAQAKPDDVRLDDPDPPG